MKKSAPSISLKLVNSIPRVNSRLISSRLNIKHKNILATLDAYLSDFEQLGVVAFETRKPQKGGKGGRPETFALLNEDQTYLLLTYCRNTKTVRHLKIALVKAFASTREAAIAHADYLPGYRRCHDAVQKLVESSDSATPIRIHHMNIEKMINRFFSLGPGTRARQPAHIKAALSMAENIIGHAYEQTITSGGNHKAAYRKAKESLNQFMAVTMPLAGLGLK